MFSYETPIGRIYIEESDGFIVQISFQKINSHEKETTLIKKTYLEICEYLDKKRTSFDIPIKFIGTGFQKRVWNELIQIPYGQTRTYKDIAQAINKPLAYRAVGMANNKNPILILVPCHRVIGESGKLVGYAGGLNIKEKLLKLETL